MKVNFFLVFMLVCVTCFGKRTYLLPKTDLVKQLDNVKSLSRIYCFNQEGEKVWLRNFQEAQITVKPKGDSKVALMLETVTYHNDTLYGRPENAARRNRQRAINVSDVDTFVLEINGISFFYPVEDSKPYFNLDSVRQIVKFKNDSIRTSYHGRKELIITLIAKGKAVRDSLHIISGVCYGMSFKDGNRTYYGVVQKITNDSIYISSSLDSAMAAKYKKEYTVYKYPIYDISELHLLKQDNLTARAIRLQDYNIVLEKIDGDILRHLWQYSVDSYNGKIEFNCACMADGGFVEISEQKGRPTFAVLGEN